MAQQLPVLLTARNGSAETGAENSDSTLQNMFHLSTWLNSNHNKFTATHIIKKFDWQTMPFNLH